MRAPRLRSMALLLWLVAPTVARAEPPEPSDARAVVEVATDGFVRLKAASLRALGFRDEQLVYVHGPAGPAPVVSPRVGDDVVFLAWGTQGRTSPRAEFSLELGDREPARTGSIDPSLAKGLVLPRDEAVLEHLDDARAVHEPLAAAEEEIYAATTRTWFRHRIARHGRLELPLPSGTVPDRPLTLTFRARGTQPGAPHFIVRYGEQELTPEARPHAEGGYEVTITVAAPLPQGRLVVEDVTPPVPAPAQDVSDGRGTWVLWHLAWTHPYDLARTDAPLTFEHTHRLLTVRGWPRAGWHAAIADAKGVAGPAPSVVVSTAARPVPGLPVGHAMFQGYRVGTGRVVLGPERSLEPRAPARLEHLGPDPNEEALQVPADAPAHLILATDPLMPAARRLAAHRRTQGIESVALPWEVFRQAGRVDVEPADVREALHKARSETGRLRYVLILGDATLDRSDLVVTPTIPTLMARTQYNGATASDALYVERDDGKPDVDAPIVGRIPFSDPAVLDAYVTRLIAYETAPPRDASRRMLRFLASEGRFGPMADRMIEMLFRNIIATEVSPAYDVALTFASAGSQFLWPARAFDQKVVDDLNAGSLFYTYVGHGFTQGFDSLRVGNERFPILHIPHVASVDVTGTPPVVIALACNTAEFDHPKLQSLGEALLARPRGPIAYVGATRICHPIGNAFYGRAFAQALFPLDKGVGAGEVRRLGDLVAQARRMVLAPPAPVPGKPRIDLVEIGARSQLPPGTSLERLKQEAFWLYNVLGDPAMRIAVPDAALDVSAKRDGEAVLVEVRGAPEGARIEISVELPRLKQHPFLPLERGLKAADPAAADAIRRNHRHANDKAVLRAQATVQDGVAKARIVPAPDTHGLGHEAYGGAFQVKAWTTGDAPVGLGVALLTWNPSSPDGD